MYLPNHLPITDTGAHAERHLARRHFAETVLTKRHRGRYEPPVSTRLTWEAGCSLSGRKWNRYISRFMIPGFVILLFETYLVTASRPPWPPCTPEHKNAAEHPALCFRIWAASIMKDAWWEQMIFPSTPGRRTFWIPIPRERTTSCSMWKRWILLWWPQILGMCRKASPLISDEWIGPSLPPGFPPSLWKTDQKSVTTCHVGPEWQMEVANTALAVLGNPASAEWHLSQHPQ